MTKIFFRNFVKLFFLFAVSGLVAYANSANTEVLLLYKFKDRQSETKIVALVRKGTVERLVISKDDLPEGVQSIDVHHPYATAKADEDGFYVFSNGMYGTFKERPDGIYRSVNCVMPIFGVRTPRGVMTVLTEGMRYDVQHLAELKNGVYTVFPRYVLEGERPYEDITIEFYHLHTTATYSDMAKCYRNLQLNRNACQPLKDRIKNSAELDYAAKSIHVRIRLAVKQSPFPEEQTEENEPPLNIYVTFDRFQQIIDEFKRQGIDKAEFCLSGWNIGGHDGRYPQIFPVEERLGGETKLREAIKKAQKEGFQVICHTNNSDAYSVSQIGGLWDEGYLLRGKDGNIVKDGKWAGGNAYLTCPRCVFERFVKSDFEKLRELGFRGLHYIDVLTFEPPRTCYAPEHPLTKKESAEWVRKICVEAQRQFGGFSSEGPWDDCISNLDYGLTVSVYSQGTKLNPLIDRHVPFWQLVYNGIVLNTPYRASANYTMDAYNRLKLVEFGGRSLFTIHHYWYRDFVLTCATDAELIASVRKIKEGFDEFETLKHLQLEFMESHEALSENVFETTFSDCTRILTNYGGADFKCEGGIVKPMDYLVLKTSK